MIKKLLITASGVADYNSFLKSRRLRNPPGNRSLTRKITKACVVFKSPEGFKDEGFDRPHEGFTKPSSTFSD